MPIDCGLMTPYGSIDLGQHWLRKWHVAWRHQTITWTNVDLASVRSSDIHLRAISRELLQLSIIFKTVYVKFHLNCSMSSALHWRWLYASKYCQDSGMEFMYLGNGFYGNTYSWLCISASALTRRNINWISARLFSHRKSNWFTCQFCFF